MTSSVVPPRFFTVGLAPALFGGVIGCGEGTKPAQGRADANQPGDAKRSVLIDRMPCADRSKTKRALFGDLHVHTAISMDAYLFDTRTRPSDAYRYAKGETIYLPPLAADGQGTTPATIDRPLDFAAVTDHAENFGNVSLCTQAGSPVYDTQSCRTYRGDGVESIPSNFLEVVEYVRRRSLATDEPEVCGEDGRRCRDAADDPWLETQRAAESHYDRSSGCDFTTFVAYEYSLTPELSKVHRNVIFRNEVVLARPIHALDEPDPLVMLKRLRDECKDGLAGCDVLAIPHNPNLSDGRMFRAEYPGTMNLLQEARWARLRSEMEPVVEMMQIKGDSECRNGLVGVGGPVDELCHFEKMREMAPRPTPDCEGKIGAGALAGRGCVDRNDFVRGALIAGLAEEARIGANPFEFGFIASTDDHDGAMGNVLESGLMSEGGVGSPRVNTNPGGLAGVWAEENSRDAIFEALRRRETFGTSGPRIEPRFFAGWNLDPALCEASDPIKLAYEQAVPMGSELTAPSGSRPQSPRFMVSALRDTGGPDTSGNPLERLQIIKGWVGENGLYEQRVFDVAGEPVRDDVLSTQTCEIPDVGRDTLCNVWTDSSYDPSQHAVYYARVVEIPSCRWTTRLCNALSDEDKPAYCNAPARRSAATERGGESRNVPPRL